ncbi:unnamed protein product [Caenorhabditis brenneri]
MTEEFTYPSLKCVLEYLEANKKFHITARSPQLRKFEKSVPLRLEKFLFQDWKICINDVTYSFNIQKRLMELASIGAEYHSESLENSEEILPGDLVLKYNNRPKYYNQFYISFERKPFYRTKQFPNGMLIHEAMKTFAAVLLGGRQEILVDTLRVNNLKQKILRIPENLKFTPVFLDIGRHSLEEILPILELPKALQRLRIAVWKPSYVENPIIQNLYYLILGYNSSIHSTQFWLNRLHTIPSKGVYLAIPNLNEEQIRRIVEKSIEKGAVIGKSFFLGHFERKFMDKTVIEVQKKFKGQFVTIKEDVLKERHLIVTPIVSIPMRDPTSELVIYGIQSSSPKIQFFIRMRVIEAELSTPVEQPGWFLSLFQKMKTK